MKPLDDSERNDEDALLAVAWEFLACRRGTIWKVEEPLWKELFQEQNYESDRDWHPGLCLGLKSKPAKGLPDAIMTLGRTGSKGPLVVKGLTEEKGEQHPTSFGELLAPVRGREFVCRAEGSKRVSRNKMFERARVIINWHKRFLSPKEESNLNKIYPAWLME